MRAEVLNRSMKIAAIFCLASTVTACNENRADAPIAPLAVTTSVVPEETPALTGQFPPEMHQYYPELVRSGAILRSADSIPSHFRIPTVIYNYSNTQLNQESARQVYAFYESMFLSQAIVALPGYKIGENERDLILAPRLEIKKRTAAIVPENTPLPAGRTKTPSVLAAETYIDGVNNNVFTYIELKQRDKNYFDATMAFATEVCQQVMQVTVRDLQGRAVLDDRERLIAQEVACNSLGTAVGAAELGLTYGDYSLLAKQPIIIVLEGIEVEYRHARFPQQYG